MLSRLVGFDSTSSKNNLPIVDFVCDYLDLPGVEVLRNFNADRTKANVLLRAGIETSDSGLGLCGHVDVVPATEPGWQSDPFTLRETDDAYFGRGACDIKGFVALAVNQFRATVLEKNARTLALLFTYDEEPGTYGAQHFVDTWTPRFQLPKYVIVGEPTELRAVRIHKGHLKIRATFPGRSAHTGYAHLGINAIEPAARAVSALAQLRLEFEQERFPSSQYYPQSPAPSLTVATIHGGSAINVVPDRCVVEIGVRLFPEMDADATLRRVFSVIETASVGSNPKLESLGLSPALLTDETCGLYQALCAELSQTETFGVSYATDAGPLRKLGTECVIFGPGSIEVAHKPNEHLPKHQLLAAKSVIEKMIRRFCFD